MRDLISLLEAASELVTLYRGDNSKIERFEVDKTDYGALFGMGIYLTDSPEVAKDYTVKGSSEIAFRAATSDNPTGGDSFKKLVAAYLRQLMEEAGFEEADKKLRGEWSAKLYADPIYQDYNNHEKHQEISKKYNKLHQEARAKLIRTYVDKAKKAFQKIRSTIRITRLTTGEYVFTNAIREGSVAKFEVPAAYLEKCIHGDRPLSDAALKVVKEIFVAGGDADRAFDLRAYDQSGEEQMGLSFDKFVAAFKEHGARYAWAGHTVGGKGDNPSLDVLWNGTHGGFGAFYKAEAQKALIGKMMAIGYVGFSYDGGVRVAGTGNRGGGGILHSAYVLWDENTVNGFRVGDDAVQDDEIEDDIQKGIRAQSVKPYYKQF